MEEERKTFEPFYRTVREPPRPPFDANAEFVTVKPMTLGGETIPVNSPFDKTKVPTRRLRQLYENRYLNMAQPPLEVAPPEPRGHVRPERVKMNKPVDDIEDNG